MLDKLNGKYNQCRSQLYQIRIKGHLSTQWSDWFDGMTITLEECGDTLLTGLITDQSELHALLKKIRDLGISLISVADINAKNTVE